MNSYLGHPLQVRGAEEHILATGKGKGMRLLEVRNGKGLEFTISLDRCADISRLTFESVNMGYFAPCGYVAPSYYDKEEAGFLKSFTAGFFTTCGLASVGTPCVDEGESFPLHGSISNTPSEKFSVEETDSELIIKAEIRDAALFGRQMVLRRTYLCSYEKNELTVKDEIINISSRKYPLMLLYHCNMGYPLLSENARVVIPHDSVVPRNDHAAEGIKEALIMERPQADFEEQCYYYDVKEKEGYAACGIFNPDIEKGLVIKFKKDTLDYFTQWKMNGEHEYVLGLEPGNCSPDGRASHRERGTLKYLEPNQSYSTELAFKFYKSENNFTEDLK